jgi:hypothetical protein
MEITYNYQLLKLYLHRFSMTRRSDMKRIVIALVSLALFANATADVQMTVKDGSGSSSTFSSNGQLVRIDGQKISGFIIIDYASGEFFMVDSKRNEIMKTSLGQIDTGGGAASLSVSLKDKGDGQKIAGYLTRKFEIIADGEPCGTVYASSKLLQNKDVRAIFESMRNMQQFSRRMMGGMGESISVCQRANMQMADVIESAGAPLRVDTNDGKTLSEMLAVDTDKKFADNHYELPDGMEVVDISERMNQAAQQTRQMMENMPDMDELMQQMQQGDGQMTEEMQQLMEQMQQQQQ